MASFYIINYQQHTKEKNGPVETIIASNILRLNIEQQQSKYVRLADQLLRILKHCRLPLYFIERAITFIQYGNT